VSDFLNDVLAASKTLVEKEVKIGGKAGVVHFRRITAGERHQLLKGQKISRQGGATSFELDLELNDDQQQRMVLFSVCKPDGTPYFANIEAVRKADSKTVQALYAVASSLDDGGEGDEPGKS
jgi:hypothetical protein